MGVYNPVGIRGICHYSIPCSNTERSLTFYEEIFGATVYEDEIGPYRFAFSAADKRLGRQTQPPASRGQAVTSRHAQEETVPKYNSEGIQGLCHFSIPVKDAEQALTFYEEILGARV